MDLDLSADQIALRDGIASLLGGRFGADRVRTGFDRAMFDELTVAGVFSLRADGFGRRCFDGSGVRGLAETRDQLILINVEGEEDVLRVDRHLQAASDRGQRSNRPPQVFRDRGGGIRRSRVEGCFDLQPILNRD